MLGRTGIRHDFPYHIAALCRISEMAKRTPSVPFKVSDSVQVDPVGPGVRMQVVQVKNLALILRPVA